MTQRIGVALVAAVVARWRERQIARPPATRARLEQVESEYGILLPDDLTALFLAADGMENGDMDELLIRFWPIDELKPALEEVPAGVRAAYEGFFVFADYSLWAHAYAIKLDESADVGAVAIIGGPSPIRIASSFREYLDHYMRQPDRLFG